MNNSGGLVGLKPRLNIIAMTLSFSMLTVVLFIPAGLAARHLSRPTEVIAEFHIDDKQQYVLSHQLEEALFQPDSALNPTARDQAVAMGSLMLSTALDRYAQKVGLYSNTEDYRVRQVFQRLFDDCCRTDPKQTEEELYRLLVDAHVKSCANRPPEIRTQRCPYQFTLTTSDWEAFLPDFLSPVTQQEVDQAFREGRDFFLTKIGRETFNKYLADARNQAQAHYADPTRATHPYVHALGGVGIKILAGEPESETDEHLLKSLWLSSRYVQFEHRYYRAKPRNPKLISEPWGVFEVIVEDLPRTVYEFKKLVAEQAIDQRFLMQNRRGILENLEREASAALLPDFVISPSLRESFLKLQKISKRRGRLVTVRLVTETMDPATVARVAQEIQKQGLEKVIPNDPSAERNLSQFIRALLDRGTAKSLELLPAESYEAECSPLFKNSKNEELKNDNYLRLCRRELRLPGAGQSAHSLREDQKSKALLFTFVLKEEKLGELPLDQNDPRILKDAVDEELRSQKLEAADTTIFYRELRQMCKGLLFMKSEYWEERATTLGNPSACADQILAAIRSKTSEIPDGWNAYRQHVFISPMRPAELRNPTERKSDFFGFGGSSLQGLTVR